MIRRRELLGGAALVSGLARCTSLFDSNTRLGIVELANMSETIESIDVTVIENEEEVRSETHELESREGKHLDCDWSSDSSHFVIETEWGGQSETLDLDEEETEECTQVLIGIDAEYDQMWSLPSECPITIPMTFSVLHANNSDYAQH